MAVLKAYLVQNGFPAKGPEAATLAEVVGKREALVANLLDVRHSRRPYIQQIGDGVSE